MAQWNKHREKSARECFKQIEKLAAMDFGKLLVLTNCFWEISRVAQSSPFELGELSAAGSRGG